MTREGNTSDILDRAVRYMLGIVSAIQSGYGRLIGGL